MIKKIFSAILCLLPFFGKAQVNINVQFPPGGLVQKNQLWNLILMNNREDITDLNIKMSLQNAVTGEVVLSAETRDIICSKGVKMITERDVQPVNYNYNSPDLSKAYLPLGSYIACYRIYHLGAKGEELLGDECVRLNIDPLSPPLLNTPADNTEIETPYPQFTWMPPAPIDMFTSLSYEIAVCEIKEGQKPIEAIQYNTPVYIKAGISQPAENYSTSYAKLEQGKSYAWQVVAVNGMSYSAKTEVWSFTVKKDSVSKIISMAPYVRLTNASSEINVAHQGFLKMQMQNDFTDSSGLFKVRNISKNKEGVSNVILQFRLPLSRGQNFLEYDLNKFGKLNKDDVYEVEYKNSIGESFFLKFIPVYYL